MKTSFHLYGRQRNESGKLGFSMRWGVFPDSKSAENEAKRLDLEDFYWLEVVSVGPKN